MIPKIIHYCWFGKGMMPQSQRDYIKSWQHLMPDYKIIRWDENNFPIEEFPYALEAYKLHKWAFVSDVARIFGLYKYGGIYMDTDVEVYSSFDPFLKHHVFSGVEMYADEFTKEGANMVDAEGTPLVFGTHIPCCGFLSAVLGAEPENQFIRSVLEAFKNRDPYLVNGDFNAIVIDGLLATLAAENEGFRYKDCFQDLKNMTIFPSSVFSYVGVPKTAETVAYHYTAWSWMPKTKKQRFFIFLDKVGILKHYRKLKKKILHK